MGTSTKYELVVSIVEKGKASGLIEVVKQEGAEGSTIFNARGAGIHDSKKMFGMSIEPEKEIMLTVVPESIRRNVVEAIERKCKLDEPGTGIGFVVNVQELFGVNHSQNEQE